MSLATIKADVARIRQQIEARQTRIRATGPTLLDRLRSDPAVILSRRCRQGGLPGEARLLIWGVAITTILASGGYIAYRVARDSAPAAQEEKDKAKPQNVAVHKPAEETIRPIRA